MVYLWLKAFHIIGIVVWFAGLFYLVRLFIYHVEAEEQPKSVREVLQAQYSLMEMRLYRMITTPGMVLSLAMAIALLIVQPSLLHEPWIHGKLGLVALLVGYHFYCGSIYRALSEGKSRWNSQQLRLLNEAPTLILVIVVLLAVFKNSVPLQGTAFVMGALVVAIALTVHFYAKYRKAKGVSASTPLVKDSPSF